MKAKPIFAIFSSDYAYGLHDANVATRELVVAITTKADVRRYNNLLRYASVFTIIYHPTTLRCSLSRVSLFLGNLLRRDDP